MLPSRCRIFLFVFKLQFWLINFAPILCSKLADFSFVETIRKFSQWLFQLNGPFILVTDNYNTLGSDFPNQCLVTCLFWCLHSVRYLINWLSPRHKTIRQISGLNVPTFAAEWLNICEFWRQRYGNQNVSNLTLTMKRKLFDNISYTLTLKRKLFDNIGYLFANKIKTELSTIPGSDIWFTTGALWKESQIEQPSKTFFPLRRPEFSNYRSRCAWNSSVLSVYNQWEFSKMLSIIIKILLSHLAYVLFWYNHLQ
jgi:hypothetical protein